MVKRFQQIQNKNGIIKFKNVIHKAKKNTFYRRTIFSNDMQMMLMSLHPQEVIDFEIHKADQIFFIISGEIEVKNNKGKRILVKKNEMAAVKKGTKHFIKNLSRTKTVKFITFYSKIVHQKNEFNVKNKID